jgi:hypothetical protein
MPANESYGKEIEKRTKELEKRPIILRGKKNAVGEGLQEQQLAQNQWQVLQNEKRNNLLAQKTESNAQDQTNQLLNQAVALGVSNSTASTLGKYGLKNSGGPTVNGRHTQSRDVTVTPSKITIVNNNNTTTNTTNKIEGGGSSGGGGSSDNTTKFKTWLSKVNAQQQEASAKRDRDYARRESSLTRAANKMLRRIETVGKSVSEAWNPSTMGQTVGSQLKMFLLIFGMRFLARYWDKVIGGIDWIVKATEGTIAWLGFGEKGEAMQRSGKGLIPTVIRLFGGDPGKETVLQAFKNTMTSVFDHFALKIDHMFELRAEAMKKVKMKPSSGILGGVLKGLGLESLMTNVTTYLGDILTALVSPEKALRNSVANDVRAVGNRGSKAATERDNKNNNRTTTVSRNTSAGDYEAFNKVGGSRRYSLTSNALGADGQLTSSKAGQVSQSMDILGVFRDARSTGRVDVARLVTGLERLQERARTAGTVAVDPEFLAAFFDRGTMTRLMNGRHIQSKQYKFVADRKTNSEIYAERGSLGGRVLAGGAAGTLIGGTAGAFFDGVGAIPGAVVGGAVGSGVGAASYGIDALRGNDYILRLVPMNDPRRGIRTAQVYEIDSEAIRTIARKYGANSFSASDMNLVRALQTAIYGQAGGYNATKARWRGSGNNETYNYNIGRNTYNNYQRLQQRQRVEEANDNFHIRQQRGINEARSIGNSVYQAGRNIYEGVEDLVRPGGGYGQMRTSYNRHTGQITSAPGGSSNYRPQYTNDVYEYQTNASPTTSFGTQPGYSTQGMSSGGSSGGTTYTSTPAPGGSSSYRPITTNETYNTSGNGGKSDFSGARMWGNPMTPTKTDLTYNTEVAAKECLRLSTLAIYRRQGKGGVENPQPWKNKPATQSTGGCSGHVRRAVAKALGLDTLRGHPGPAKDYVHYLHKFGFKPIPWEQYSPQKGDICINGPIPGHPYGHASLNCGSCWCSDFQQRDIWGGPAFRKNKFATVFRHIKNSTNTAADTNINGSFVPTSLSAQGKIDFNGDGLYDAYQDDTGNVYRLNSDGSLGEKMDVSTVNGLVTGNSIFTPTSYGSSGGTSYDSSSSGSSSGGTTYNSSSGGTTYNSSSSGGGNNYASTQSTTPLSSVSGGSNSWEKTVLTMKSWYERNIHTYHGTRRKPRKHRTKYQCPGVGWVWDDCSGFVSACCNAYGINLYDAQGGHNAPVSRQFACIWKSSVPSKLQAGGFTKLKWSRSALRPFDITAGNGHVEIFAGGSKAYSWGGVHDLAFGGMPSAASFGSSTNYVIWRCTNPKAKSNIDTDLGIASGQVQSVSSGGTSYGGGGGNYTASSGGSGGGTSYSSSSGGGSYSGGSGGSYSISSGGGSSGGGVSYSINGQTYSITPPGGGSSFAPASSGGSGGGNFGTSYSSTSGSGGGSYSGGSWPNCVNSMGKWFEANIHEYRQGGGYSCPLIGGAKVRPDCTGFVMACMQMAGVPFGTGGNPRCQFGLLNLVYTSPNHARSKAILSYFDILPYNKANLRPYDVMSGRTHGEIYAGNGKSWSWGSCHDGRNGHQGMPAKTSWSKYDVILRWKGGGGGSSGSFDLSSVDGGGVSAPGGSMSFSGGGGSYSGGSGGSYGGSYSGGSGGSYSSTGGSIPYTGAGMGTSSYVAAPGGSMGFAPTSTSTGVGGGINWRSERPKETRIGTSADKEYTNHNAMTLINFLRSKGLPVNAAIGVAGSIMGETAYNPYHSGWDVNGPSGGIAAWHDRNGKGNFSRLKEFAQARGKPWTDIGTQADFLWYSLTEGSYKKRNIIEKLKNAKSIEEASYIWGHDYEVFSGYNDWNSKSHQRRMQYGRDLAKLYKQNNELGYGTATGGTPAPGGQIMFVPQGGGQPGLKPGFNLTSGNVLMVGDSWGVGMKKYFKQNTSVGSTGLFSRKGRPDLPSVTDQINAANYTNGVIIVHSGGNDIALRAKSGGQAAVREDVQRAVAAAAAKGNKVIFIAAPWMNHRSASVTGNRDKYNEWLKEAALSTGSGFIDTNPILDYMKQHQPRRGQFHLNNYSGYADFVLKEAQKIVSGTGGGQMVQMQAQAQPAPGGSMGFVPQGGGGGGDINWNDPRVQQALQQARTHTGGYENSNRGRMEFIRDFYLIWRSKGLNDWQAKTLIAQDGGKESIWGSSAVARRQNNFSGIRLRSYGSGRNKRFIWQTYANNDAYADYKIKLLNKNYTGALQQPTPEGMIHYIQGGSPTKLWWCPSGWGNGIYGNADKYGPKILNKLLPDVNNWVNNDPTILSYISGGGGGDQSSFIPQFTQQNFPTTSFTSSKSSSTAVPSIPRNRKLTKEQEFRKERKRLEKERKKLEKDKAKLKKEYATREQLELEREKKDLETKKKKLEKDLEKLKKDKEEAERDGNERERQALLVREAELNDRQTVLDDREREVDWKLNQAMRISEDNKTDEIRNKEKKLEDKEESLYKKEKALLEEEQAAKTRKITDKLEKLAADNEAVINNTKGYEMFSWSDKGTYKKVQKMGDKKAAMQFYGQNPALQAQYETVGGFDNWYNNIWRKMSKRKRANYITEVEAQNIWDATNYSTKLSPSYYQQLAEFEMSQPRQLDSGSSFQFLQPTPGISWVNNSPDIGQLYSNFFDNTAESYSPYSTYSSAGGINPWGFVNYTGTNTYGGSSIPRQSFATIAPYAWYNPVGWFANDPAYSTPVEGVADYWTNLERNFNDIKQGATDQGLNALTGNEYNRGIYDYLSRAVKRDDEGHVIRDENGNAIRLYSDEELARMSTLNGFKEAYSKMTPEQRKDISDHMQMQNEWAKHLSEVGADTEQLGALASVLDNKGAFFDFHSLTNSERENFEEYVRTGDEKYFNKLGEGSKRALSQLPGGIEGIKEQVGRNQKQYDSLKQFTDMYGFSPWFSDNEAVRKKRDSLRRADPNVIRKQAELFGYVRMGDYAGAKRFLDAEGENLQSNPFWNGNYSNYFGSGNQLAMYNLDVSDPYWARMGVDFNNPDTFYNMDSNNPSEMYKPKDISVNLPSNGFSDPKEQMKRMMLAMMFAGEENQPLLDEMNKILDRVQGRKGRLESKYALETAENGHSVQIGAEDGNVNPVRLKKRKWRVNDDGDVVFEMETESGKPEEVKLLSAEDRWGRELPRQSRGRRRANEGDLAHQVIRDYDPNNEEERDKATRLTRQMREYIQDSEAQAADAFDYMTLQNQIMNSTQDIESITPWDDATTIGAKQKRNKQRVKLNQEIAKYQTQLSNFEQYVQTQKTQDKEFGDYFLDKYGDDANAMHRYITEKGQRSKEDIGMNLMESMREKLLLEGYKEGDLDEMTRLYNTLSTGDYSAITDSKKQSLIRSLQGNKESVRQGVVNGLTKGKGYTFQQFETDQINKDAEKWEDMSEKQRKEAYRKYLAEKTNEISKQTDIEMGNKLTNLARGISDKTLTPLEARAALNYYGIDSNTITDQQLRGGIGKFNEELGQDNFLRRVKDKDGNWKYVGFDGKEIEVEDIDPDTGRRIKRKLTDEEYSKKYSAIATKGKSGGFDYQEVGEDTYKLIPVGNGKNVYQKDGKFYEMNDSGELAELRGTDLKRKFGITRGGTQNAAGDARRGAEFENLRDAISDEEASAESNPYRQFNAQGEFDLAATKEAMAFGRYADRNLATSLGQRQAEAWWEEAQATGKSYGGFKMGQDYEIVKKDPETGEIMHDAQGNPITEKKRTEMDIQTEKLDMSGGVTTEEALNNFVQALADKMGLDAENFTKEQTNWMKQQASEKGEATVGKMTMPDGSTALAAFENGHLKSVMYDKDSLAKYKEQNVQRAQQLGFDTEAAQRYAENQKRIDWQQMETQHKLQAGEITEIGAVVNALDAIQATVQSIEGGMKSLAINVNIDENGNAQVTQSGGEGGDQGGGGGSGA